MQEAGGSRGLGQGPPQHTHTHSLRSEPRAAILSLASVLPSVKLNLGRVTDTDTWPSPAQPSPAGSSWWGDVVTRVGKTEPPLA